MVCNTMIKQSTHTHTNHVDIYEMRSLLQRKEMNRFQNHGIELTN